MNRTFTIDEDVIRRLVLRRDHDESEHDRSRHFAKRSPRFWRGLANLVHESPLIPSRSR